MSEDAIFSRADKVKADAEAVCVFLSEAGPDQIEIPGDSDDAWRKQGIMAWVYKPMHKVTYTLTVKTSFDRDVMTITSTVTLIKADKSTVVAYTYAEKQKLGFVRA